MATNNGWNWNTNTNYKNNSRLDSIYTKNVGDDTFIDVPKRDPEPEYLTNLRALVGDKIVSGLNAFDPNSWNTAQTVANNALSTQSNLLGQLPDALNRNNNLVDEFTNIARTGNIPTAVSNALNASVNNELQSSMGSMLNNLAQRGVLNSSVTTAGINQLSQNAADAYNKNYQEAYRTVMSGLGQGLQGAQNNTSSLLSAIGSIGNIP